jgi:hypothetical protein
VWWCGSGVCGGVGGGGSPLALEHSKVCTLCDFGHLQFLNFWLVGWDIKLKMIYEQVLNRLQETWPGALRGSYILKYTFGTMGLIMWTLVQ